MSFKNVSVLQSLNFPTACNDIKISPNFLVSVGTYKPCLKIHNLNELALKNERNLENEPLKVEILQNDAKKLAVLRNDRYIEIHAKYGLHYTIRIPACGRDLLYNNIKAELLTLTDNSIVRLNLEEGRFMKSIIQNNAKCFSQSYIHNLLAVGCEDSVNFYDYRTKTKVCEFDEKEINAASFKTNDGLVMSVGNTNGIVKEYDIRSQIPLHTIDCKEEIKQIKYNENHLCIMTKNEIYAFNDNKLVDSYKTEDMNSFVFDKGLFIIASESQNMQTIFNPKINEAPVWCTFIDNFTNDFDDFVIIENDFVMKHNLERHIDDGNLKIYKNTYYLKKDIYNAIA